MDSAGYGAWSSATKIIIATDLPKAATLVSPKGYTSDTTPTYTWNAIANSTWYQLWVNDSNGNKINKWLTAAQVGCNSGQKTCSYSPSIALTKGAALWWIRTWNSAGYGAWSDVAKISIATHLPKTTSLVLPKGNTSDTTPSYTWNAIANATWYYLWVNDASGNKIKKWLTATQAGCNSGQKLVHTPLP